MPTAARLVAALAFASIGWLAVLSMRPGLAPGLPLGWFPAVAAGLGAVCGWMILGGRAGRGWIASGGAGMRTAVTLTFLALLLVASREMILRSMRHLYRDPFEAVIASSGIMIDYARAMGTVNGTGAFRPETLAILLGGGFAAGLAAEFAARRWG